jgi:autotransporter translocation and assembly factor TamB
MRRRLAHAVFVFLCGTLAAGLGVGTALLYSPSGRALLARLLTDHAPRLVRGSLRIGRVSGRWVDGFTLNNVVIQDTAGELLAKVPRIEVHYRLANLLAGRMVFSRALLHRPEVQIVKHRGGRLNFQEVFRLNEGPGGGASPLIELNDLTVDEGRVTIRVPWNPDRRLHTTRQVDSALAAERVKPGRRIEPGSDGLQMVRTVDGLEADFPLVRLATPDRQPILLQIDRLAARVSDPFLEIRDLTAEVRTKDDSLVFILERAMLPGTSVRGRGRLDWPRDTLLYHLAIEAPRLALADLRFVSPFFPAFTGKATLRARSVSGARTEWDIQGLSAGDRESRVTGHLVALTDAYRGLGFRNLGLDLDRLDLDVVRPYLDTLPFHGRLTGHLDADGFFDRLKVSLDWLFDDAAVPDGAENRIALSGGLRLGGDNGIFFEDAQLPSADLDLRTVRLVAPSVILDGRLGLAGTLAGPWKNVVFEGTAEHRDGDRPTSRVTGTARLDTRGAVLGLETDLTLDSLSFDGIRRSFPRLTARGSLGGQVKLAGTLERLAVDAQLGGGLGRIEANGTATVEPPRWGGDSLRLRFSRLDLQALSGSGPPTSLHGLLSVTGTVDSGVPPTGRLDLRLDSSRIRELVLDSAAVTLHAADGVITLDTGLVHWAGGRLDGAGTLGWTPGKNGRTALHLEARELVGFDSLVSRLTGFSPDTTAEEVPLTGRGRADLVLEGSRGALRVNGTAAIDSAQWLGYRVKNVGGRLTWASADSSFDAAITVDSLRSGELKFGGLFARVAGRRDAFRWAASGDGGDSLHVGAAGRFQERPEGRLLHADSVNVQLLGRRWTLSAPLDARIGDSLITVDTVRFETGDGSGSLEVTGSLPRRAPGDLALTGLGIRLQDLYALMQRDTANVDGRLTIDARLGGTAAEPTLRGSGALTGGVFRDFDAPLIRGAFDFRDKLLRADLTLWRTGTPVLQVDASLPLDLALKRVARRQLAGPVSIVATGDSINLAIAEAFTPNLRRVAGHLDVDARVEGTWENPRLGGGIRISDGGADVPGLGVREGPITGRLRFTGDSVVADSVRIGSATGDLTVTGTMRFERLTQPVLGLTLSMRDFELMDVPDYMRLRVRGGVRLDGPLVHPVMTGRVQLSNSVIYFADLVTKDIVNLEDPANADLVDTLALRQQNLRANFQSRFLDSLAVRDLRFNVEEGVWLRSHEANFQLAGGIRVNKTRRRYQMEGDFEIPRGTYALQVGGLINRTFTVDRGTVRYQGDLNAALDVEARHVVKTPQGSGNDIPVIAHITGTLDVPRLTLSTPPDRPPMSEPELISLLMIGTADPAAAQLGNREQSVQAAAALAANALSNELARAFISKNGNGLDLIEIRPPLATSGFVGGVTGTPAQLAVGRALTSKLFLIANAGICVQSGQSSFTARNLGASLEYRFVRELRALVSAEPVQTCFARGTDAFALQKRYQFGAELRWDRNY